MFKDNLYNMIMTQYDYCIHAVLYLSAAVHFPHILYLEISSSISGFQVIFNHL